VRAVSILYHDVVSPGDWESSGFRGPGTTRYKLDRAQFEGHLAAIAKTRHANPTIAVPTSNFRQGDCPFLLTFDDGGESAYSSVADLLETYGWKGHFLVTAGYVGTRGFLNAEQIRILRKRGHIIGSHSFSHPERMSLMSQRQLVEEWKQSVAVLSDILGESVSSASVPRGCYVKKVAEAASLVGIRVLFNSEPTTKIDTVNGCLVLGRFTIFRGMAPAVSGELVSGNARARQKQWLYWNIKKLLKSSSGIVYDRTRDWCLRKNN
jgi:peptidoglycan/xylan/chitin deacetylase (PgdA/CDA1 family)